MEVLVKELSITFEALLPRNEDTSNKRRKNINLLVAYMNKSVKDAGTTKLAAGGPNPEERWAWEVNKPDQLALLRSEATGVDDSLGKLGNIELENIGVQAPGEDFINWLMCYD